MHKALVITFTFLFGLSTGMKKPGTPFPFCSCTLLFFCLFCHSVADSKGRLMSAVLLAQMFYNVLGGWGWGNVEQKRGYFKKKKGGMFSTVNRSGRNGPEERVKGK